VSVEPASPSSAPHDPDSGLGEHATKAILDYKRKHPPIGPAQIRAQLKRFLGWRVSARHRSRTASRRLPKGPPEGSPRRRKAPRQLRDAHRNALWQLDFKDLPIGAERCWLLVIEDDFSRFIVGYVLAEGPTSEVVVAAIREAIRLHGKPERVYTDRGAAFTAWRDVTACEGFSMSNSSITRSVARAGHRTAARSNR
jgi:putative transposase